jgi:hypothetical protein
MKTVLALDEAEFVALRMALAEDERVEEIDLVLASADADQREAFLGRVPKQTKAAYEGRLAKLRPVDKAAAAGAVAKIGEYFESPRRDLIRAQALLEAKKYGEAGAAYEAAFKTGGGERIRYYVAASAWTLAGNKDAAFRNLEFAVDSGWTDLKMLEADDDLKPLRADPRWAAFAARLESGRARRLASLPEKHKVIKNVKLPEPKRSGKVSVETALASRRSERRYADSPLTLAEVSQLLWSAYGVSKPVPEVPALGGGLRTAPSAGACYPLEVYLAAGRVTGLDPGIYRYEPSTHELQLVTDGDRRAALYAASWNQAFVRAAPASIV